MNSNSSIKYGLGFGEESINSIDFNTIDEDLEQFQQDPIVKESLEKGIDLRSYARGIEDEIKDLQVLSFLAHKLQMVIFCI